MLAEIALLLAPRRHPPLLARRRAEAIAVRVRWFATLFAALTLAWIALDAVVIGKPWWVPLALARVAAASCFGAIAIFAARGEPTLRRSRAALAALMLVPVGFFVAAQHVLQGVQLTGFAQGVGAAYSFVPFLLACGIAAFPLTALEAILLAALPFGAELWFVSFEGRSVGGYLALDAFWLLFLLACVATFAAMSQVKLMIELVQRAVRDPLTRCLRRESGLELLQMQLALAIRRNSPLAVLFADLDHFKRVNDRFGHDAGDVVLAHAAEALRCATRDSDSVLRWGGEEFVLVLPDANSADAVACIERLRAGGVAHGPDGHPITLSIGIAEYIEDHVSDARALVDLADQRMYTAKQAGRNRYVRASLLPPVTIFGEISAGTG